MLYDLSTYDLFKRENSKSESIKGGDLVYRLSDDEMCAYIDGPFSPQKSYDDGNYIRVSNAAYALELIGKDKVKNMQNTSGERPPGTANSWIEWYSTFKYADQYSSDCAIQGTVTNKSGDIIPVTCSTKKCPHCCKPIYMVIGGHVEVYKYDEIYGTHYYVGKGILPICYAHNSYHLNDFDMNISADFGLEVKTCAVMFETKIEYPVYGEALKQKKELLQNKA